MSDRVLYHANRQNKSSFSLGYITALDDPRKLRNQMSETHYKNVMTKKPKGDKYHTYASGYRAAKRDLEK